MNAYELADKLDEAADELESEKIFAWEERTAATMLRQQADRIAELEKVLEHEGISVGRDLLNGGVALSKKLPQTKPLSDEEIEQIAKQHLAAYAQFIGAGEVCYEGEIEFARAIEERHGIK